MIRRIRTLLVGLLCALPALGFAGNTLQLVPEADNPEAASTAAEELINLEESKDFWNTYNQKAKDLDKDLGGQIRSGIFSRNSILNIGVYVIRFMLQISLVIGSFFIIKAGYSYALVAIGGQDKPEEVSKSLKNALIGLFIISMSYAIIRLLQMAFLQ